MDTPTTAYHSVRCAPGRNNELGSCQLPTPVSRPSTNASIDNNSAHHSSKAFLNRAFSAGQCQVAFDAPQSARRVDSVGLRLFAPVSPVAPGPWRCSCPPHRPAANREASKIGMAGGCASPRSNGGHGWDGVPGQLKHEAVDPRTVQNYGGYFCPTRRYTEYAENWSSEPVWSWTLDTG